ncbi:MAG TPA: hypothetical protein VF779_02075 [Pyrinomonadaceae bacterium]
MKSCPICNRTYADDTLTFCLVDGSILSAPYDPQTKVPYHQLRVEPPSTEILHPTHEPTDTLLSPLQPTIQSSGLIYTPASKKVQSRKGGISKRWLVAGISTILVLIAGLVIMLNQAGSSGNRSSTANKTENNLLASNTNTMPTPVPSFTPQSISSRESTPAPTTNPTPPEQLNIVGTWSGKHTGFPATMIINNQKDDSFDGTINTSGFLIAISGHIVQNTRQITFQETQVLKNSKPQTDRWLLGVNNGSISSDGSTIIGKGKDKKRSYSWSFSKKRS